MYSTRPYSPVKVWGKPFGSRNSKGNSCRPIGYSSVIIDIIRYEKVQCRMSLIVIKYWVWKTPNTAEKVWKHVYLRARGLSWTWNTFPHSSENVFWHPPDWNLWLTPSHLSTIGKEIKSIFFLHLFPSSNEKVLFLVDFTCDFFVSDEVEHYDTADLVSWLEVWLIQLDFGAIIHGHFTRFHRHVLWVTHRAEHWAFEAGLGSSKTNPITVTNIKQT